MHRRNVKRFKHQQFDGAVDAAEESEIRGERRNGRIITVGNFYREQIVARMHGGGDVERECRLTAGVRADRLTVEKCFRLPVRRLKTQEERFAGHGAVDG